MPEAGIGAEGHVGRWWRGFAVALFLLVPADLLTTLLAVTEYGMVAEANPVMRWLLGQGMIAVLLAHLAVTGMAVVMFHAAVQRIRQAPAPYLRPLTHVVNLWLAALLVGGVLLVGNNLLVLV